MKKIITAFFVLIMMVPGAWATSQGTGYEEPGLSVLDIDIVLEKGHTGIGYLILSSLFGESVIQHMVATSDLPATDQDIQIEGVDNGVTLSMMAFSAKLAFAIFPIFIFTLTATGFLNTLQNGEFFGEESQSNFLMMRWGSGIMAAFPMPDLYGMAIIQKLILVLAIFSNGLGNAAAEDLVRGAYLGPLGADVVAGGIMPLPPNTDITGPAEMALANVTSRKACAYHARSLGMSVEEVRTVCQGAVSAGSSPVPLTAGAGDSESCIEASEISDFGKKLCEVTRNTLKNFELEVDAALALETEKERVLALKIAQEKYWAEIRNQRTEFDQQISGITDGSDMDPMKHMHDLISTTGWPGLGLTYMRIASQVEGMKTTITNNGETLDYSMLPEISRVGKDLRYKLSGTHAELEAARILAAYEGNYGSLIEKEPKGWFSEMTMNVWRSTKYWVSWAAGGTVDTVHNGIGSVASAQGSYITEYLNSGSGIETVYDFSSNLLGGLIGFAVVHDVGNALINSTPGGKIVDKFTGFLTNAKGGENDVLARTTGDSGLTVGNIKQGASQNGSSFTGRFLEQVKSKFGLASNDANIGFKPGDSIIGYVVSVFFAAILFFLVCICFINVAVIPKLPALFVAIMAIDWAITLLIICFGAPLWMVLNLSVQQNGKALLTPQVLRGLQSLMWVVLFPALIVFSVAISIIVMNLAIPLVAGFIGASTQDGMMADLVSIFATPILLMFTMTLICFLATSLIVRLPEQFAGYLGINPMRGQMIDQALSFMGGNSHMTTLQEQTSIQVLKGH
jgi:hypothetical protein